MVFSVFEIVASFVHEDAIEKGMLIKDIPEPNRTGVLKVGIFTMECDL